MGASVLNAHITSKVRTASSNRVRRSSHSVFQRRQHRRGLDYRCELPGQLCQRQPVVLFRGVPGAVQFPVERHRRVVDDVGLEPEVLGHPRGRRDAVVGREPEKDRPLGAGLPEALCEVRADEGAVDPLGDDRFVGRRFRLGLERVARPVRPERRPALGGVVSHVHHGKAGRPEPFEQFGDVPLGVGVVPLAPPVVVEPRLDVDGDERRLPQAKRLVVRVRHLSATDSEPVRI